MIARPLSVKLGGVAGDAVRVVTLGDAPDGAQPGAAAVVAPYRKSAAAIRALQARLEREAAVGAPTARPAANARPKPARKPKPTKRPEARAAKPRKPQRAATSLAGIHRALMRIGATPQDARVRALHAAENGHNALQAVRAWQADN